VIGDGLSALGVERYAMPLLEETVARLAVGQWRMTPVVIARQARVALGDEIGQLFGAELVAVLIGERPGLSAPDSLGVYLTFAPAVGRLDAERNCISNVHAAGLDVAVAADTLAYLMGEARRRRLTGLALKDDRATGAIVRVPRSASFLTGDA
jgi:ethanolamine ammonia-lyase small subunit